MATFDQKLNRTLMTYDPKNITCIIGAFVLQNFITISLQMDEQKWNKYVGTNGETTRVKSTSRMGTVSITVPQNADINISLSLIEKTGAMFPIYLQDHNGWSVAIVEDAYIIGIPTISYNNNIETITWTFNGNIAQAYNITGG
jgi:preprotein translocase subunit SecD